MAAADGTGGADVGHADRLAAAGVVGDGDHRQRRVAGVLGQRPLQRVEVNVPLEGQDARRVASRRGGNVEGGRLAVLDVGPRRVEVGVVGHDVARLQQRAEEDALGRAPLVGGDDVLEAKQLGLVNYVTTAETLLDHTKKILDIINSKAPLAIAGCIKAANAVYDETKDGYALEIEEFGNAFATEDMKEGTTAFLEKRKAIFKGE